MYAYKANNDISLPHTVQVMVDKWFSLHPDLDKQSYYLNIAGIMLATVHTHRH